MIWIDHEGPSFRLPPRPPCDRPTAAPVVPQVGPKGYVRAHVWRTPSGLVYEPAARGVCLTTRGGHLIRPGMTVDGRTYLRRESVPAHQLRLRRTA